MQRRFLICGFIVAVIGGWAAFLHFRSPLTEATSDPSPPVTEQEIRQLCAHCHRFPEPDSLTREVWRKQSNEMAALPGFGANVKRRINPGAVADWYEQRAPRQFEFPALDNRLDPGSLSLKVRSWSAPGSRPEAMVSHVKFADVLDEPGLELIVCEMRHGGVWLARPAAESSELELLADVPHPAHAEAVDLDRDGFVDLVVANLGSFLPLDHNLGTVEWLRQTPGGKFERHTLWSGLGRVADVQAIDFDGDGDLDLVVGEFGWRTTGHVLVLEQTASGGSRPEFALHYVDGRSGAIHAPAVDLDGDGRLDVIALLAQQHELVAFYRGLGNWKFEIRELYRAPHPSWGSSGMQLVDLDRDGDLDVLLTNGDTLDDGRIKPYHGVQWLENTGDLVFTPHPLAIVYGAHRAEAADLDGDGDLDIAVCAFTEWKPRAGDASGPPPADVIGLVWLEQTLPGRFERHNLAPAPAIYPTLHLADYDGDGDVDIATGIAAPSDSNPLWVEVWENLAAQRER